MLERVRARGLRRGLRRAVTENELGTGEGGRLAALSPCTASDSLRDGGPAKRSSNGLLFFRNLRDSVAWRAASVWSATRDVCSVPAVPDGGDVSGTTTASSRRSIIGDSVR